MMMLVVIVQEELPRPRPYLVRGEPQAERSGGRIFAAKLLEGLFRRVGKERIRYPQINRVPVDVAIVTRNDGIDVPGPEILRRQKCQYSPFHFCGVLWMAECLDRVKTGEIPSRRLAGQQEECGAFAGDRTFFARRVQPEIGNRLTPV